MVIAWKPVVVGVYAVIVTAMIAPWALLTWTSVGGGPTQRRPEVERGVLAAQRRRQVVAP